MGQLVPLQLVWKWLAQAELDTGPASRVLGTAGRTKIWLTTALLPPPKRGARSLIDGGGGGSGGGGGGGGARRKNSGGKSKKHFLYGIRNKTRQELEISREGEDLIDHVALNALLFQEVHLHGAPVTDALYVSLAGLEHGWEGREVHFAVSARINALGESMYMETEDRTPITMLNVPRMPYTLVPELKKGSNTWLARKWLMVWVLPPPQGTVGMYTLRMQPTHNSKTSGYDPWKLYKVIVLVSQPFAFKYNVYRYTSGPGMAAARAEHNEQVVEDLVDAINFSDRTGVKLSVVGLEMQGLHSRTLGTEQHSWAGAGGVGKKKLAGKSPQEIHWHLMRDELADLVEQAVQRRAKGSAHEHRAQVQDFWLKDWTHQGMTLAEAAQQVVKLKKDSEWAREWFKGYCEPYLEKSLMSMPGAVGRGRLNQVDP
jgi:hypothetical protein